MENISAINPKVTLTKTSKFGVTPTKSSTFARVASYLCLLVTLLFTLGVGEMRGDLYLIGSMNNWDADNWDSKWKFVTNKLEVELDANTKYWLRIKDGTDHDRYFNSTVTNTILDWNMDQDNKSGEIILETKEAGVYIFQYQWTGSQHHLSIYYPRARLKKGSVLYFDATSSNVNKWRDAAFHAKYVYKFYDTGSNLSSDAEQWSESPVETWVHYTTVPNNDYVGQIQVCRMNPSGHGQWNYSNNALARERSDDKQNCMIFKSECAGYDNAQEFTWKTYCPPMSSATLSDNSTTTISWQSGAGTSGNPYLVPASGTIKVSASATSAVDDANMTKKYDFKVNTGSGASSAQSGTGSTYDKSSLSNNTTYEISLDTWNNYNSTDGTKNTSATHLWYKALTMYSVTHTLTNATRSDGRTGDDAAAYHLAYTATYSVGTGYDLPTTITVKFGSTTKTSGTDYTWNSSTGVLSIPVDKIDDDVTVIVSGVPKTTSLTFDPNTANHGVTGDGGATATYDATTLSDITHVTIPTGYDLTGYWTTKSGDGTKIVNANGTLVSGTTYVTYTGKWCSTLTSLTLYARYSAKSYSVTLNTNGGTINAGNVTSYTYAIGATLPTNVTKTGYTFGGWYDNSGLTGSAVTEISTSDYGDKEYWAKWTINNHDITYTSPTGGSYTIKAGSASAVSTDISNVDYSTTITLAATPANVCYEFDGWTVTGATSGESITVTNNQFSMPDEDVTVAASFAQVNLAKNKTVVAGYEPGNTGEHSEFAVDGSTSTGWTTYSGRPTSEEWLYVDLGAYYQLNSIEVDWGSAEGVSANAYSTDYIIQTRQSAPSDATEAADDNKWFTIAHVKDVTASGVKTTSVDSPARYVRLHSLSRNGNENHIRIKEFRVFGTGSATAYTTPTLTTAEVSSYPNTYDCVVLHLVGEDSKGAAIHAYKIIDESSNVSVVTTNASDLVTISSLSILESHTLTIQAMDPAAQLSEGQDVAVLIFDPTYNLALNKTAVSPGTEQAGAAGANDGNRDTRCSTSGKSAEEQYWYVDLGAYYQLRLIDILWEGAYSQNFIIQVAQTLPSDVADDSQWFTIYTYSGTPTIGNGADDHNYLEVDAPARYVRIKSLENYNAGWGFSMWEFRVYGSRMATEYASVPTLTTAEVDSYPNTYDAVVLHLEAEASKGEAIHTYRITDEEDNVSIVTTNGSNLVTISTLSILEPHTLTIQAIDSAAQFSASEDIDVLIWDPTANLALNKTVVAGYTNAGNADEVPAKAVDGNTGTSWTTYKTSGSTPASDEWLYVDLGAYYQLSSIEMVWGDVYSTDYVLHVRQDAPASAAMEADDNLWYPVAEVTDATASSTKTTAVNVPARYVRMHSKTRNAGWLNLKEFRVFGTGYADADTNVPVITTATAIYNDDGKAYLNLVATDDEDGSTNWFYLYNPNTESYSLVQANGSNQIVIDGLTACENYAFQAQAMDQSAQLSTVSNIAVRVPIISTTNLALGKTATAGTTQGGFASSNAVDGNTGTMWSGNNSDRKDNENQWISIDLEDKYSIDSIKITWGDNSGTWAQNYELQVSYDGTDYEPIAQYTTTPVNQNCKYTFTNVPAQYVRVWANKAGSSYGMEICEIAVHGSCYDDTELPIMLFAEKIDEKVYATSADIRVGAIHKSIASTDLLYHVDYTDNTDGSYSGSTTISAASVTNGVFTLSGLQKGHSYTANIYVAKTSDIAENRSSNYKTVSFTTEGTYSKYYFASDTNGWLAVNGGEWTDAMDAWRFQTTEINGFYKLEHAVAADATWTYILYDRIHAGRTTPGDHKINVTAGKDFIMTMKGLEVYVSNYHTIYIAGDAVGTAENALTYALTWTDNTHAVWEGFVEPGETFRLIFPDPYAGNESYVRTNAITPSAVTYSGSQNYARLTFNLNTWEYAWTPIDFVIYRTGDKADDSRATIGSVESYAGGTINAPIEFRMKVRDLGMWHSLCLPFTVSAVKVWDEDDGAYYDIVPYYRSGGTFYTGHYVIRTPDPEKVGNLPIEEFGNWYDPESPTGYLPSKDTPYIIQWHHDYFSGKYISFFGAAGQTIPTFSAGDAPSSDNVVKVCVNKSMQTGSVAGAYMLESDYGNGAWLRLDNASEARPIPPFECYLLVNNPTRARYIAIRPGMTAADTPTGWDDVVNSETKTHIVVYSISGICVTQYNDCSINEAGQRLSESYGEGLYILRADNESVKLMVGGK